MPTPGQHALFEKLERSYGSCPRWQRLTSGHDFEAMRTERASVFLAGLIAAFMQAHIGPCSCTSPRTWRTMENRPYRKTLGGGSPSASDAQAV